MATITATLNSVDGLTGGINGLTEVLTTVPIYTSQAANEFTVEDFLFLSSDFTANGFGFTYGGNTINSGTITDFTIGWNSASQISFQFLNVDATGLDPTTATTAEFLALLSTGNDLSLVGTTGVDNIDLSSWSFDSHDLSLLDGDDVFIGRDVAQTVDGGVGNDDLMGGLAADTLYGQDGDDTLTGNAGDDSLAGSKDNDELRGGGGADEVRGGEGFDLLYGGAGDDLVSGGIGFDEVLGGQGDDTLVGNSQGDSINGGNGNDIISGGTGHDYIEAGNGSDIINGGRGDDLVLTGAGNDTVFGGKGSDLLVGGDGDDFLKGGRGHDKLGGDLGVDTLKGGPGRDEFVFVVEDLSSGTEEDVILDFSLSDNDQLEIYEYGDEADTEFNKITQIIADAVQDGKDTVLNNLGSGQSLRLKNFDVADIGNIDFDFDYF